MAKLELSEVMRDLRSELHASIEAAEGELLRFEVGPIEVEFTVAITKEGGASGKVKFWVIELGADATMGEASTQRIKLTLQPKLPGGVSPEIAGEAGRRER